MPSRGPWDWHNDLRAAYRHFMKQRAPIDETTLYVSHELAIEIQNNPQRSRDIEISMGDTTYVWQGIPMKVDNTLPSGCFIFEEGGADGND
jgi:hypothetical protein